MKYWWPFLGFAGKREQLATPQITGENTWKISGQSEHPQASFFFFFSVVTDKHSHHIYNTNGLPRLWAQKRSFRNPDPFLGCPCTAWASSCPSREPRGVPGARLNTNGPARDIFKWAAMANSSWVAKGKREEKITFPFWTREVIQWGLRHNNLYKEKKEEEWRAWKFPLEQQWCADFSSTEHARQLAKHPEGWNKFASKFT